MSRNEAMKRMLRGYVAREIDTRPGAHSMLPQNQPKLRAWTCEELVRAFRVPSRIVKRAANTGTLEFTR